MIVGALDGSSNYKSYNKVNADINKNDNMSVNKSTEDNNLNKKNDYDSVELSKKVNEDQVKVVEDIENRVINNNRGWENFNL